MRTWLAVQSCCCIVTVRERQHRYLQAAHRNVYQTVDEDILPFPEIYQQREDYTEPLVGRSKWSWMAEEKEKIEEKDMEDEEDVTEGKTEEDDEEEEEQEEEEGSEEDSDTAE